MLLFESYSLSIYSANSRLSGFLFAGIIAILLAVYSLAIQSNNSQLVKLPFTRLLTRATEANTVALAPIDSRLIGNLLSEVIAVKLSGDR